MIVVSAFASKHAVPFSICLYAVLCIIIFGVFDNATSEVLLVHRAFDCKYIIEGGSLVIRMNDCILRGLRSKDSHLVCQR